MNNQPWPRLRYGDTILADYASKIWQGLEKDFYLWCWELFFQPADQALSKNAELKPYDIKAELAKWDHDWRDNPPAIAVHVPAHVKAAIAQLLTKY